MTIPLKTGPNGLAENKVVTSMIFLKTLALKQMIKKYYTP